MDDKFFPITEGPYAGIVKGWALAKRLTHGRSGYPPGFHNLDDARDHYERATGQPAPPVQTLSDQRPAAEPSADRPPVPGRVLVENENGRFERTNLTPEQIDGLRGLGLWP